MERTRLTERPESYPKGGSVDARLARQLIACNNEFYRHHAASFSATRQTPWQGWARVVEASRALAKPSGSPRVLDVACGNMRFERFLAERVPAIGLSCLAVDSTPELAEDEPIPRGVQTRTIDVLEPLLDGCDPLRGTGTFDLTVCFGFLHHVPGEKLRRALLDALVRRTRAGGIVALALWQFMDDPRLARKALAADEEMRARGFPMDGLDANDHFLGWQDGIQPVRYCHHFNEVEIDELSTHLAQRGAYEVDRFSSDGRSGALNRYLICRIEGPNHP